MTRGEAIHELQEDKALYETDICHASDGSPDGDLLEALDMAIQALQADRPMVIKCKPFLSEEDFKAFAEQVSDQNVILIPYEAEVVSTNTSTKSTNISTDTSADTVEVVRCKDCQHANECHKSVHYTRNESNTATIGYSPIEWCSRGERSEE